MDLISFVVVCVLSLIIVWLVSFVVEALRPAPIAPEALPWDPAIKPQYISVDGVKLRYIKSGSGPVLVLLHTLRTQLDLFHKVIPGLGRSFTVYALDYPGHGYSDIPAATYDADFFVSYVNGFLEALNLDKVTLAGVSIGASISLIIAARGNPRLIRAVAINPYDYCQGKGMARASFLGRVFVRLVDIPFIGDTIMRLRSYVIMKAIIAGGVYDPRSISPELMKEMYRVGNRSGHYRGFINLLRNSPSWERARDEYNRIKIPVKVVWGAQDWALPEERRHDESLIPGVESVTVDQGGHFLSLDRPAEVVQHIWTFAAP